MKVPVIILHDVAKIGESDKKLTIDDVLSSRRQHLIRDSNAYTSNNPIEIDQTGLFSVLYSKFTEKAEELFGKLNYESHNSEQCWAFCTNNQYWAFNPHIHQCKINSVYYLNVPKHNGHECGPIMFTDDPESGRWESYQPKNDDLLIFPGDLYHDPNFVPTDEWRISVNMEICCRNDIKSSAYK